MKKLYLAVLGGAILLSGCSGDKFDVKSYEPLSFSEVSSNRAYALNADITQKEKDSKIATYINSSIMVTEDNLIRISEPEFKEIETALKGIDNHLRGDRVLKPDGTPFISDEFADALMLEFAKTPYTWKRTAQKAIGFDASSKFYFVDVDYATTQEYKKVIPDSRIVDGNPFEAQLKKERYDEYVTFMSSKAKGQADATAKYASFQKRWGTASSILEEQQGLTLLDRVKGDNEAPEGLGGYTYSGLLEDNNMKQGAKMTVRFIFKYDYNLGEETSISVDSLYVKDYTMDNHEKYSELEEDNDALIAQSLDLLKPFIRSTLLSYQRAVQTHNKIGLYSLYTSYGKYDKFYREQAQTVYTGYGEMAMKVVSRQGTQVQVIVDRQVQQRPKYTNMTMPTYREKVLYNMVLSNDDKVKIKNFYILQRTLIGEPISIVRNVEGVSDQIQYSSTKFSEANEQKVNEVLKNFMQIVFMNDISSSAFSETIDLGVGNNTMMRVMENIQAIKGNTKYNYIINWNSRTNSYVALNLREVFELEGYNLDTESMLELVNRNGTWHVINYQRLKSVKTVAGKISNNKGVFSMNTPEGSKDVKVDEKTGDITISTDAEKQAESERLDSVAPEEETTTEPVTEPATEPSTAPVTAPVTETEETQEQPVEQQPVEEVEVEASVETTQPVEEVEEESGAFTEIKVE